VKILINSKKIFFKAVLLVFLLVSFPFHANGDAQNLDTIKLKSKKESSPQISICPKPEVSAYGDFNNLKKVNLFVQLPPLFMRAFICHKNESSCAEESPETNKFELIEQLKKDYSDYPSFLSPDNLAQIFLPKIEQELDASVQKVGQNCLPPEVSVLNQYPDFSRKLGELLGVPDTLTIIIHVSFFKTARSNLGVLSGEFYQPNLCRSSCRPLKEKNILAINLDENEASLKAQLLQFFNNFSFGDKRAVPVP